MEAPHQPGERPKPPDRGRIKFLFLGIAPIPIGFLLGQLHFISVDQGKLTNPTVAFHIFTLACCILGAIGMCDGYQNRRPDAIIAGVLIGVILCFVDIFIISFVGCCAGMRGM